jgi:hypothetical protein
MWLELKQNVFTSSSREDLSAFTTKDNLQDVVVPIFRGAMFHQYDPFFVQFRSDGFIPVPLYAKQGMTVVHADKSVPLSFFDRRMRSKGIRPEYHVAIRRIARSTDEHTMISAILPAVGTDDTASILHVHGSLHEECALVANLNSLALDYACAQKIGGTDIRKHNFEQLPILGRDYYQKKDLSFIVDRVLELSYSVAGLTGFARDLGFNGPPFPWDEERRALLRAELDAWYARAYGLSRDDLRYILDPADLLGPDYPSETFRVLKKNEIAKFGEYRTQRLVLAAWDRQAAGQPPISELDREPIVLSSTHEVSR